MRQVTHRHNRYSNNHLRARTCSFVRLLRLCVSGLVGALILATFLHQPVRAVTVKQGRSMELVGDEKLNDDLLFFGRRADLGGAVEGDAGLFCQFVTVDGSVKGALLAGANDVTINGQIGGSVVAACGRFSLDGEIDGSCAVFSESVEIGSTARLARDLYVYGDELYFEGYGDADLVAHGKSAMISGTIEGDVEITASEVEIRSGTVINGDLTITGCDDPVISPDAVILGDVTKKKGDAGDEFERVGAPYVSIYFYLSLFVIGALVILISRRHFAIAAGAITGETLRSVAFGLLGLGVGIALFFTLLITLVGIPASLLTLAALILFMFLFGQLYTAGAIGHVIIKRGVEGGIGLWLARLLVGLAIVAAVSEAPLIGWAVYIFAGLIGFGGFIIGFLRCRAEKDNSVNALLGAAPSAAPTPDSPPSS